MTRQRRTPYDRPSSPPNRADEARLPAMNRHYSQPLDVVNVRPLRVNSRLADRLAPSYQDDIRQAETYQRNIPQHSERQPERPDLAHSHLAHRETYHAEEQGRFSRSWAEHDRPLYTNTQSHQSLGSTTSTLQAVPRPSYPAMPRAASNQTYSQTPHQDTLMTGVVVHRRGPWSQEEDRTLVALVHADPGMNWVTIAAELQTRTPKQCRERYHQNLKPSINHSPITDEEGVKIEELVRRKGKKWAEIARELPGRSDNAVKNWWNGSQNRQKRQADRRNRDGQSHHGGARARLHRRQESDMYLAQPRDTVQRPLPPIDGFHPSTPARHRPDSQDFGHCRLPSLASTHSAKPHGFEASSPRQVAMTPRSLPPVQSFGRPEPQRETAPYTYRSSFHTPGQIESMNSHSALRPAAQQLTVSLPPPATVHTPYEPATRYYSQLSPAEEQFRQQDLQLRPRYAAAPSGYGPLATRDTLISPAISARHSTPGLTADYTPSPRTGDPPTPIEGHLAAASRRTSVAFTHHSEEDSSMIILPRVREEANKPSPKESQQQLLPSIDALLRGTPADNTSNLKQ